MTYIVSGGALNSTHSVTHPIAKLAAEHSPENIRIRCSWQNGALPIVLDDWLTQVFD